MIELRRVPILEGKTIVTAVIKGYRKYDDEPILRLTMSDGKKVDIISSYGGYTGDSIDEYPAFIKACRR